METNKTLTNRLMNWLWKIINGVGVSDVNSIAYYVYVLWILHGLSDQQGNNGYLTGSFQPWTLLRNWTGNQLHKTEPLLRGRYSFNCLKRASPFKKADNLLEPKILVCPDLVQFSPHLRIKSLSVYHTIFSYLFFLSFLVARQPNWS